jgi:hypothetical protein
MNFITNLGDMSGNIILRYFVNKEHPVNVINTAGYWQKQTDQVCRHLLENLMSTGTGSPATDPLIAIETTLRTEVIDIFRRRLEPLIGLDRASAYNQVMNEPGNLHQAFGFFRRKPELFEGPLGSAGNPDDTTMLRCGETLGHVKALILRACARRFFRRELGAPVTVELQAAPTQGMMPRMKEMLGIAEPPPPRKQRIAGKGEDLFWAIRDYLRHDWQARLIPSYSALTPKSVAELGERLLEIREPCEVRAMAGESLHPLLRPLLLSNARKMVTPEKGSIDPELLWKLWEQMDLGRLFGNPNLGKAQRIIAEIADTSKDAINLLMPLIGRDIRHFTLFLFLAYKILGRLEFKDALAESGESRWKSHVYARRLAKLPDLPVPELAFMVEFYAPVLIPSIGPEESRRSIFD